MALKIVFIACVATVALADLAPLYHLYTPPNYEYTYGVADAYSGNNYEVNQKRNGYNTEGQYIVDLPDGRKQIVTYVDNGHGFLADVKYEGEAKHPAYVPAPSYQPAPHPTYG
ncbi:pro-resilin-like [Oratosquilla oratoria]|uniref:pro-resilin-like n=1 Tax=Oratosquilla oratoria TaxID=337810 RepID=UPI003F76E32F